MSRRRPLKLRIDVDMMPALDGAVTQAELAAALAFYCGASGYLRRLLTGAWRIDLAGNVCGAVTREDEAYAKRVLARCKERAALRDESPSAPAAKRIMPPAPKPKPAAAASRRRVLADRTLRQGRAREAGKLTAWRPR
jgi:sRNA-binding protein